MVCGCFSLGQNMVGKDFFEKEESKSRLFIKVFLQGPYDSLRAEMPNKLQQGGFLPITEPYTALWKDSTLVNGGESMDSLVYSSVAIVDWIIVELRDSTNIYKGKYRKACLLRTDGIVLDLDGRPGLVTPDSLRGKFYILVNHRNHLAAMPTKRYSINSGELLDFSDPNISFFNQSKHPISTGIKKLLAVGDLDNNNQIVGSDLFKGPLRCRGNSGYLLADYTLDGQINHLDCADVFIGNTGLGAAIPFKPRIKESPPAHSVIGVGTCGTGMRRD